MEKGYILFYVEWEEQPFFSVLCKNPENTLKNMELEDNVTAEILTQEEFENL